MALLYHQVLPEPRPGSIIPTVSVEQFRVQIEYLTSVGQVVPLEDLLRPSPSMQPRFAVTLDDDYQSHGEHVLPVLQRYGVPATFFLSGRWMFGLGRYWWENLDQAIADRGLNDVCRTLGVRAETPHELATHLEIDFEAQARIEELVSPTSRPISEGWFKPLFESGLGIGFHTLHHPRLTRLDDEGLDQALSLGHAEMATANSAGPLLFAYPHGRAGRREASAAEQAGFAAAFTTSKEPVGAGSDRYLVGRWEPGALPLPEFSAELAWRLHAPIRHVTS